VQESKINSWVISFKDFDVSNAVVFTMHGLFFMHYPNDFLAVSVAWHFFHLAGGTTQDESGNRLSLISPQTSASFRPVHPAPLRRSTAGPPLPCAARSRRAGSCVCHSCR